MGMKYIGNVSDFVEDYERSGPRFYCPICKHNHYSGTKSWIDHKDLLERRGIAVTIIGSEEPITTSNIDPVEVANEIRNFESELEEIRNEGFPDDLEGVIETGEELEIPDGLMEEVFEDLEKMDEEDEEIELIANLKSKMRTVQRTMDRGFLGTARVDLDDIRGEIISVWDADTRESLLESWWELDINLTNRQEVRTQELLQERMETNASIAQQEGLTYLRQTVDRVERYMNETDFAAAKRRIRLSRRAVAKIFDEELKSKWVDKLDALKQEISTREDGFRGQMRRGAPVGEIEQTNQEWEQAHPTIPEGMVQTRAGYYKRTSLNPRKWIEPRIIPIEQHEQELRVRARARSQREHAERSHLYSHKKKKIKWKSQVTMTMGSSRERHPFDLTKRYKQSELPTDGSIYVNAIHPETGENIGGASFSIYGRNSYSLSLLEMDSKWQGHGATKRIFPAIIQFLDIHNITVTGYASPLGRYVENAPAHLTPEEKDVWARKALKYLVRMYKSFGAELRGGDRQSLVRKPHPERWGVTISGDFTEDYDGIEIELDLKNIYEIDGEFAYIHPDTHEVYILSKEKSEQKQDFTKLDYDLNYVGNVIEKQITEDVVNFKIFTNMKNDFKNEDFTVYHGPITREGPFEYYKNGKKVVLVKDWDNINERFDEIDYIPLKAKVGEGSHHAKIHGFATNFEPEEKPKKGNKYRQMYADVVLMNDIYKHPNSIDLTKYQVSIGFEDEIVGNQQIIKSVDHLAMSDIEIGRCTTEGGPTCFVKKTYDQNLNEVIKNAKTENN